MTHGALALEAHLRKRGPAYVLSPGFSWRRVARHLEGEPLSTARLTAQAEALCLADLCGEPELP